MEFNHLIPTNVNVQKVTEVKMGLDMLYYSNTINVLQEIYKPTAMMIDNQYLQDPVTTTTEKRYAPTEEEALAIAWGLYNGKMFVPGSTDITVITDQLLIISHYYLFSTISILNSPILKLKEKTLQFNFTIQ